MQSADEVAANISAQERNRRVDKEYNRKLMRISATPSVRRRQPPLFSTPCDSA